VFALVAAALLSIFVAAIVCGNAGSKRCRGVCCVGQQQHTCAAEQQQQQH